MKLKLNELIPGKYYHCYIDTDYQYYFQYLSHDDEKIYGKDYFVEYDGEKKKTKFYSKQEYICDIVWYNTCLVFKKCLLSDFVNYLPNNHPDKRRYKIESLLAIKTII